MNSPGLSTECRATAIVPAVCRYLAICEASMSSTRSGSFDVPHSRRSGRSGIRRLPVPPAVGNRKGERPAESAIHWPMLGEVGIPRSCCSRSFLIWRNSPGAAVPRSEGRCAARPSSQLLVGRTRRCRTIILCDSSASGDDRYGFARRLRYTAIRVCSMVGVGGVGRALFILTRSCSFSAAIRSPSALRSTPALRALANILPCFFSSSLT